MAESVDTKPSVSTGTVATGGAIAVVGLIVANLGSISPFIDKVGLASCIAIGCLVFGGFVIIMVLQWIGTHGAETATTLRTNAEQQTQILSEVRLTQIDHGRDLKASQDLIEDIHRAVECRPRTLKDT